MAKKKSSKTNKSSKATYDFDESDIGAFKVIRKFLPLLNDLHSHADCPNRKLHYDEYICLLLLYFFNPVLTSLRGIQHAAKFKKIQKKLGIKKTSLGSLSEASHVFDPELLVPIIEDLGMQAESLKFDHRLEELDLTPVAVDGTLLKALPKMLWALWLDPERRGAKIHLEFDILRGLPLRAEVTHANASEVENLKNALQPGKLYVMDAGYRTYKFLNHITCIGSSFLVRLQDNAVYNIIKENELTDEDRAAGIEFDKVVWLGSKGKQECFDKPVRIIQIHCCDDRAKLLGHKRKLRVSSKKTFRTNNPEYTLLLATDLMNLSAEQIGLYFKYRWHIELFFRWFKCILGCTHLLSHSKNGIQIQVYCALIASLLIRIWTGRKPTKRTFETICLYISGWVTSEELEEHISTLQQDKKSQTSKSK